MFDKSSANTANTVSSKSKNNHTIQQPKKKLQNQKHGRKNKKSTVVEDDTSSSSSSSEEEQQQQQQHYQPRNHYKYKSSQFVDQVYAGPTFNNAPAPSALPIPAFNARGSPINYPQPLYHSVNPSLQQQSLDLMNLITPQKVITAYELEKTNLALSEIQRGLRSMLKIES
ncbi:hypothetical protein INT48_003831 [Thamnidium elegans]|uniref:Uncharacterized protein n=1 Tax=Thamnidium elegans TaxID=101142 RepID=A0A8H7VYM1_9FUNG|nr:hypothetical protein INT48_003831 [Thamnidium elegans]